MKNLSLLSSVLALSTLCLSAAFALELYEEDIDDAENVEFAKIAAEFRTLQERRDPIQRPLHPKVHGCLSGTFRILEDRPEGLKDGVFKETKTFSAVVRFSNGGPISKSDDDKDVRGMAIKLFQVPGEKLLATQSDATTQDFTMNNMPVPFTSDPQQFVNFFYALNSGMPATVWFLMRNPAFAMRVMAIPTAVKSVTSQKYWSQGPIAFGNKAVKFNAQSCGTPTTFEASDKDPNILKNDLSHYAAQRESCWDFAVQLQTDPALTPIEDNTIEWTEALAPSVTVARLTLPRQDINDPAVVSACQALTFTPWHAIEEHRPLGKFNRSRRSVYAMVQKRLVGEAPVEPTSFPQAPIVETLKDAISPAP